MTDDKSEEIPRKEYKANVCVVPFVQELLVATTALYYNLQRNVATTAYMEMYLATTVLQLT